MDLDVVGEQKSCAARITTEESLTQTNIIYLEQYPKMTNYVGQLVA